MTSKRYQQGIETLNEYTDQNSSKTHYDLMKDMENIAPDIGRYIIEFAYGDIYSRGTLDNKQRALTVLSSLITQGEGSLPQLELHINTARNAGLTEDEIVEAMIQLIPYVGFPSVLNAIKQAQNVFQSDEPVTAASS